MSETVLERRSAFATYFAMQCAHACTSTTTYISTFALQFCNSKRLQVLRHGSLRFVSEVARVILSPNFSNSIVYSVRVGCGQLKQYCGVCCPDFLFRQQAAGGAEQNWQYHGSLLLSQLHCVQLVCRDVDLADTIIHLVRHHCRWLPTSHSRRALQLQLLHLLVKACSVFWLNNSAVRLF